MAVLTVGRTAAAQDPLQRAVDLGEARTLPMTQETVRVTIDHQHATMKVRQVFHNRTSGQLEGRFAYQAGEGATVTGFAYYNGEQKIVGEVFEKDVANAVYDRTVARKADPALLQTDGEGSFSFKVFPIAPAEDKRVELELQQWLPRRRGIVELALPVTRSDADIDVVLEDARGVKDISSPTHKITTSDAGTDRIRVRASSASGSTSQFVLRWQPADKAEVAGGRVFPLRAYIHRDPGQDAYLVMSLAARPVVNRKAVVAKDVTLVIDHSGSMSGEPLERARAAALDVVRRLSPGDRLNVVLFDDTVDLLYNRPEKVGDKTRAEATEFIERMIDGGGTDLASALTRSFKAQHDDTRPKNLLFLTDGQSDAMLALDAAGKETKDVRVFTMGLGSGVDKALLSQLAKSKRGKFTFVESAQVLESRVASVYRHIEAPVLVGLELQTDGPTLTRMYPPTLPDLFQGDELVVVARVRGSGPMSLELTGRDASGPVRMTGTIEVPESAHRPWVGRLWANARIDHLGERMALHGETAEMRDETIELALAYDVITKYTSFLAIPESELTWETAKTLGEARERKAEIRAKLEDATALADARDATPLPGSGPVTASTPTVYFNTDAESAPEADEDDYYEPASDAPMLSSRQSTRLEYKRMEKERAIGNHRGAAGCASCTTGGGPGPAALLVPLLLLAVRRRRELSAAPTPK